MQRRAYASGPAALLAVLLAGLAGVTGCSADSGTDDSAIDSKAGSPSGTAVSPGKYRTLLEPCGSVPRATLHDLLPGAALLPEDQRERVYRGTPSVTYDTDRRVGCSWKADGPDASHQLALDFERVVSYDPAVSDDDRAQEVYAGKETAAGLPTPRGDAVPPSRTATPRPTAPSGSPGSTAPVTPTASTEGLEPRVLSGLGDAAFLDDVLARAGSTAQRRTVSVVFRTSNVIVTVRYGEQPARITETPDSERLQGKAQELARRLAERFDE